MDLENLVKELDFKAIRSSGAGGQHVNKVSSKIELSFDLENSKELSAEQKDLIFKNLASRFTKESVLRLQCGETRSQHKNKEIIIKRFLALIEKGLSIPKERRATRPSKTAINKRLDSKKKLSLKKSGRKKPDLD